MKGKTELAFYVSVGAGMALATASFTMLSGLFELAVGGWVVVAVLLGGGVCAMIAASVGELASMYPAAPGIRTYLKAAFGDRTSLFLVHLYLLFLIMIAGVESYLFALVIRAVLPGIPALTIIIALLVSVMAVNIAGLELPRFIQIVTAATLITTLAVLGAFGYITTTVGTGASVIEWSGSGSALASLPAAIAMAIFLYIGFEWVTPLGLRPQAYERAIPRAMGIAIAVNTVAYCLFALGVAAVLDRTGIVATPLPQIPYFEALLGSIGVWVAVGLSGLAILSTFNAGLMGSSRLIFALTREGMLPQWCGTISLRTGAPVGSVLLMGSLATVSAVVVVALEAELLAAVIGSAIVCLVYGAFMLAVLRLRKTRADASRSFRTPLFPWVQWVLAIGIPLMGVQVLLSQPSYRTEPVVGMVMAAVVAGILTRWSESLGRRRAESVAAARQTVG